MSDSSIALNPVIDEPSKPIPSSSAPSSSDGVIAKLFRCPSMSVNQKRTYSAPSFFSCFMTSLRASGSEVARSLLSIIPIALSLLFAEERSWSQKRSGEVNPLEFPLVTEFFVHPAHRSVAQVVLRPQVAVLRALRRLDLRKLEPARDPAAARGARDAGHPVLGRVRQVLP